MTLEQLRFDGIVPGKYAERPDSFKALSRGLADWHRDDLLGATRGGGMRGGGLTYGALGDYGGLEPLSTPKLKEERTKPEDIARLEEVLTATYGLKVEVTNVSDVRTGRKPVRQIDFAIDGGIAKVWVFKAEPGQTRRELTLYHLISKQGVPTARPIGYEPKPTETEYPHEVAILGGIVEHAGDSYDRLLGRLRMSPGQMATTTINIGHLIGRSQIALTAAQREFERFGIDIPTTGPRRELTNRLLAALHFEPQHAEGLLKACEALAHEQSALRVISHGDLHTGNIVTITEEDAISGQATTRTDRFGIIDWDSIAWDHPFGDLADFWVHNKRQADRLLSGDARALYDRVVLSILAKHRDGFNRKAAGKQSPLQGPDDGDFHMSETLWHLYELFDPLRSDPADIRAKAEYHARSLGRNLSELAALGHRSHAEDIRRELALVLKDHQDLHPWFLEN